MKHIVTLDYIKKTVEDVSGISDISIKTRKRYIVYARYAFHGLVMKYNRDLKKPSLQTVGNLLKQDHTTVLHGRSMFNEDINAVNSLCYDIYHESIDVLECVSKTKINNDNDRFVDMQNKYREVISSLIAKLSIYRNNEFIKRLSVMNEEDIREAEEKLKIFLKVKESFNKKTIKDGV